MFLSYFFSNIKRLSSFLALKCQHQHWHWQLCGQILAVDLLGLLSPVSLASRPGCEARRVDTAVQHVCQCPERCQHKVTHQSIAAPSKNRSISATILLHYRVIICLMKMENAFCKTLLQRQILFSSNSIAIPLHRRVVRVSHWHTNTQMKRMWSV